jgi:adenylate cyclase
VHRRRWRRRRTLLLVLVAVSAGGLGILAHATGAFHRTELSTIDTRFRIRGPNPGLVKNFVVVGVDQQTFNHFSAAKMPNQWPFRRRYHARVIDQLLRAGAREIAFDVQFTEPTDPTDDNDLASAVTHARHMVLATTAVGRHGSTDVLGGNANLRSFGARAGNATVIPDTDGVLRRMQFEYQGLDSFGVAIAQNARLRPVTASTFGGPTQLVPIDFAGPPGTVPYISYWRVYDGRFPASMVRGKIVIVGAQAATLQDLHDTATSGAAGTGNEMIGPEVDANIAATALAGVPLRNGAGWVNILLIIALGCVPPLLGLRGWVLRGLLGSLIAGGLYAVAVQLTFNSGRIVTFIDPLFALAIGIIGTLAVVYLTEAFERQYARTLFSRFVPPGVVDEVLARAGDDLRLGGLERVCTVMFTDLRGFTSFSEAQPAAHVIEVVNFYLNEMTEAIMDAGGTLVDYMGDGIMAVFGAPLDQADHADRALTAAREMLSTRLPRFNEWLTGQGHPSAFRMGIGLNSGKVMCGNVGAAQRVAYTVIGDTTNTASRLEGMTKGQPHMLFVSGTTREWMQAVPDDLEFVGDFEIRGRTAKMPIYSIPDQPEAPGVPAAS